MCPGRSRVPLMPLMPLMPLKTAQSSFSVPLQLLLQRPASDAVPKDLEPKKHHWDQKIRMRDNWLIKPEFSYMWWLVASHSEAVQVCAEKSAKSVT